MSVLFWMKCVTLLDILFHTHFETVETLSKIFNSENMCNITKFFTVKIQNFNRNFTIKCIVYPLIYSEIIIKKLHGFYPYFNGEIHSK